MTDLISQQDNQRERIRQLEINGPDQRIGLFQGWAPDNSDLDALVDFVIAMGCFDTGPGAVWEETLGPTGQWLRESFYGDGYFPELQSYLAEVDPGTMIPWDGGMVPVAEAPAFLFDPNDNFWAGGVAGELFRFLMAVGALPNLSVHTDLTFAPSGQREGLSDIPPSPPNGRPWITGPWAGAVVGGIGNPRTKLLYMTGLPSGAGALGGGTTWHWYDEGTVFPAEKAPHAPPVPAGAPVDRPWRSGDGNESWAVPPGCYLNLAPGGGVYWGMAFNGVWHDAGGTAHECSDAPDYLGTLTKYGGGATQPGIPSAPVVAQERCPTNPGGHITSGATGVLGSYLWMAPRLSLAIPPMPFAPNDAGVYPTAPGGNQIPLDPVYDQPVWPGRAAMRTRIAGLLPAFPALYGAIYRRLPTRGGQAAARTFPYDDRWQACRTFEPWRGTVWCRQQADGVIAFRGHVILWGTITGGQALFTLPPGVLAPPRADRPDIRSPMLAALGRYPFAGPVGWPYSKKFDLTNPRTASGLHPIQFQLPGSLGRWACFTAPGTGQELSHAEGTALIFDNVSYVGEAGDYVT